jgi:deoxyribonuclease V
MRIRQLHSWDLTPKEAVALQRELAGRVDTRKPLERCDLIAGADVSYNRFSPVFYAAVVVLRTSDWSVVEKQDVVRNSPFPYVPGLLSFREGPALVEAFGKLESRPDAVMLDGQGIAHPRRFGIASHLGLWLDVPTLGCAKSLLIGKYKEPGKKRLSKTRLVDGDDVIGSVVRTRDSVKPVFVSVGHRIDQASAVRLVLQSARGYRIPEPTRQAHLHVNVLRRLAGDQAASFEDPTDVHVRP